MDAQRDRDELSPYLQISPAPTILKRLFREVASGLGGRADLFGKVLIFSQDLDDRPCRIDKDLLKPVLELMIDTAVKSCRRGIQIEVQGQAIGTALEIMVCFEGLADLKETIGLDFCRRAIEAHGGLFRIDKNPRMGWALAVTLPGVLEDSSARSMLKRTV